MDLQTSKLQSEIRRIENESATKISNMSEKIKEVGENLNYFMVELKDVCSSLALIGEEEVQNEAQEEQKRKKKNKGKKAKAVNFQQIEYWANKIIFR